MGSYDNSCEIRTTYQVSSDRTSFGMIAEGGMIISGLL